MCLYVQMPLNVKSSKICLKEVIFSTRSNYVTTAIMNVSEQLTAEVNKHVNTAKEKIIREFATIEANKRNKKQKFRATTTVRSSRFSSCLSSDCSE